MNKTTKWVIGIIVVILVIWGINSVVQESKEAAGESIKVGVIIGLTGNYQDVGQRIMEGVDLALLDIQKNNFNKKIEVIYGDSKSDTKTAITVYRKLVNVDKVKIIIVAHSNISLALAPLAQKEEIIMFSIYSVAAGIPETGNYIFRNDINLVNEMKKLSESAFNEGYRNMAVLSVNTEGSIGSTKEFIKGFTELGGKILAEEKYGKDETDYRSYLIKMKVLKPDAIFSLSAPKQMGMIINQARELNMNQPFMGDWHMEGIELIKTAGKNADGLIYSHSFVQNSDDEIVKKFVDNYRERYSQEADYRSALSYDTLIIINNAVNKCAVIDNNCFKEKLFEIKNMKMVTGMITISQTGDTDKEIVIKTVKNGEFVEYKE